MLDVESGRAYRPKHSELLRAFRSWSRGSGFAHQMRSDARAALNASGWMSSGLVDRRYPSRYQSFEISSFVILSGEGVVELAGRM
jgi:hypothetical protein